MTTDAGPSREGDRRRRRRRATSAQGAPPAVPTPAPPVPAPPPIRTPHPQPPASAGGAPSQQRPKSPRRRRAPRETTERGLRDLVGAGPSQLGVDGALRGRDVNRPTAEDIAEAEQDLVIVHRNWQPTDQR